MFQTRRSGCHKHGHTWAWFNSSWFTMLMYLVLLTFTNLPICGHWCEGYLIKPALERLLMDCTSSHSKVAGSTCYVQMFAAMKSKFGWEKANLSLRLKCEHHGTNMQRVLLVKGIRCPHNSGRIITDSHNLSYCKRLVYQPKTHSIQL